MNKDKVFYLNPSEYVRNEQIEVVKHLMKQINLHLKEFFNEKKTIKSMYMNIKIPKNLSEEWLTELYVEELKGDEKHGKRK